MGYGQVARWGVAEWIERPLLMLEVRGSNPGHSKIPLLYPKLSGSSEIGVLSLVCIGGDTGLRPKKVSMFREGYFYAKWLLTKTRH